MSDTDNVSTQMWILTLMYDSRIFTKLLILFSGTSSFDWFPFRKLFNSLKLFLGHVTPQYFYSSIFK